MSDLTLRKGYAEYTCKCCPDKFIARVADRNRGWARFCSKSCSAFWKSYGKRRGHQTLEMRESALHRNNIERNNFYESIEDRKDGNYGDGSFVYVGGFGPWEHN